MRERRFVRALFLGAFFGLGGIDCAARATGEGDGSPGDVRGDGERTDGGDVGVDIPYRDVPMTYDVFREDRCPGDAGTAMRAYTCDPFVTTATTCASGEGCYPWIEYPSEPCGHEVYHADCFPVGSTPSDGFCTSSTDCAPGLTCFVTGSGNRCLSLCRIDGSAPQCPKGRVCEPTDLPDFGACD